MLQTQKTSRSFWGLFLLSSALHIVVVVLPWPNKAVPPASEPASEESLKTHQLAAISTVSLPTVSLPAESQSADEPNQPAATVQQTPAIAAQSTPPAQTVQIQPQTVQIQPQTVQPQTVQPQPVQQDSPKESPAQAVDRSAIEVDPAQSTVMLLGKDFPDLEGAQSGCYGVEGCRQLSGNYRDTAAQLVVQLKAQGYQITKRNDIDDAGHRVFEAIAPDSPDKTYYLNIFASDAGNAVYVMAMDILSLAQLQQLSR
ncbi:MAG: hypothetical protein DCF25_02170 [Leptolyngbya foveolarum]|uniref:Uncharacterized protein n=1 Tax=Leptolyngbya foveolarum TaxID=47253 RepID=A0A2W4UTV4_9CYAN|nr:MAG: hypothetical protein DCF25_02170 [Leptolyngbya foveolarum]